MIRFAHVLSALFAAMFIVLMVLGLAAMQPMALADEPLTGGSCSGCSCSSSCGYEDCADTETLCQCGCQCTVESQCNCFVGYNCP